MPRSVGLILVLAFCFAPLGIAAHADDVATARAARLTFLQGAVTIDHADNTAGEPAQMNLPLLSGSRIATGESGQAEIEFEDGSLIRLTPNSAVTLDDLSLDADGTFLTRISLLHGLAYAELRATAQYRYTVDADGDLLSPLENATLRINLDAPPAKVSVLDGRVHVERRAGDALIFETEVRSGDTFTTDISDPSRYALTPELAVESWDAWNEDRDEASVTQAATRTSAREGFAGAQGYGWSDLDANGSWYNIPEQGGDQNLVWQPDAAAGSSSFDPYGDGSWNFEATTGYVWASAYSWGWTPYRCGNWGFYDSFGWGWSPGPSCGGFGWAFAPGGYVVNIISAPRQYRATHIPFSGPGRPHPIVRVDSAGLLGPGLAGTRAGLPSLALQAAQRSSPRRIGDLLVQPLRPVGTADPGRHGAATGLALERDFPIDRASRAPLLGVTSTQPAMAFTGSGWRSMAMPRPVPSFAVASPNSRIPYTPSRSASSVSPRSYGAPIERSYPPPAYRSGQARPSYAPPPAVAHPPPAPAPHAAPAPAHPAPR